MGEEVSLGGGAEIDAVKSVQRYAWILFQLPSKRRHGHFKCVTISQMLPFLLVLVAHLAWHSRLPESCLPAPVCFEGILSCVCRSTAAITFLQHCSNKKLGIELHLLVLNLLPNNMFPQERGQRKGLGERQVWRLPWKWGVYQTPQCPPVFYKFSLWMVIARKVEEVIKASCSAFL